MAEDFLQEHLCAAEESCIIAVICKSGKGIHMDEEIKQNSWLTLDADADFLFNVTPANKWKNSLLRLGIKDANLSPFSGRA